MKYINCVLIIITLFCLYVIGCVGLGWLPSFGESENAEQYNNVALNLSYSFIAGWIFYILVTYLPYKQRKHKFQQPIKEYFELIYGRLLDSAKSAYPLSQHKTLCITEEGLKQRLRYNSVNFGSCYAVAGSNMTILQHMCSQRTSILNLIEGVLNYKEYLDEEQIVVIEHIKNSLYFSMLNALSVSIMDNEDYREKLASELYRQIELSKSLLNGF